MIGDAEAELRATVGPLWRGDTLRARAAAAMAYGRVAEAKALRDAARAADMDVWRDAGYV